MPRLSPFSSPAIDDAPKVESIVEPPSKFVGSLKAKGVSHEIVVDTIRALKVVSRAKKAEAKEADAANAQALAERVAPSVAAAAEEEEVASEDQ